MSEYIVFITVSRAKYIFTNIIHFIIESYDVACGTEIHRPFQSHLQTLLALQTQSSYFPSLSPSSLICKIRIIRSSHTAVGNITEDNPSAILENYASLSWSSFPHHGCPFPSPSQSPYSDHRSPQSLPKPSVLTVCTPRVWSPPCHPFDHISYRMMFQIPTFCPDLSIVSSPYTYLLNIFTSLFHRHLESKTNLTLSPLNLNVTINGTNTHPITQLEA